MFRFPVNTDLCAPAHAHTFAPRTTTTWDHKPSLHLVGHTHVKPENSCLFTLCVYCWVFQQSLRARIKRKKTSVACFESCMMCLRHLYRWYKNFNSVLKPTFLVVLPYPCGPLVETIKMTISTIVQFVFRCRLPTHILSESERWKAWAESIWGFWMYKTPKNPVNHRNALYWPNDFPLATSTKYRWQNSLFEFIVGPSAYSTVVLATLSLFWPSEKKRK